LADSDAGVRRAARLGDAWLVNPHTRLDELDWQMRLYRAERAQRWLPAPAALPVLREVCVAATDEQAIEIARPHLKDNTTLTSSGVKATCPHPPKPRGGSSPS
jgi:alkanesulfonate monooxygenase SsuD/methylene tetrahydromethanopterin reductase-like flavin-dependent oxidoreductase (luciferase family)